MRRPHNETRTQEGRRNKKEETRTQEGRNEDTRRKKTRRPSRDSVYLVAVDIRVVIACSRTHGQSNDEAVITGERHPGRGDVGAAGHSRHVPDNTPGVRGPHHGQGSVRPDHHEAAVSGDHTGRGVQQTTLLLVVHLLFLRQFLLLFLLLAYVSLSPLVVFHLLVRFLYGEPDRLPALGAGGGFEFLEDALLLSPPHRTADAPSSVRVLRLADDLVEVPQLDETLAARARVQAVRVVRRHDTVDHLTTNNVNVDIINMDIINISNNNTNVIT